MKISFLMLLICSFFVRCKKQNTNPADIVQQMRVLEYKSATPLGDVKVEMYSCIPPPGRVSCDTGHLIFTGYTDENGVLATREFYHAVFGITLTKENYITASGAAGDRYMYPAAYVNIHLIKENSYTDTTAFVYYTDSALGKNSWQYINPPPADTTLRLQLPGDSTYTIYCGVVIPPLCIADTCHPVWLTNNTVNSLRVQKFGDTTITIRY